MFHALCHDDQLLLGGTVVTGTQVRPGQASVSSVLENHLYRGAWSYWQTKPPVSNGRRPKAR
jgi:hypothetical protein